MTLFKKLCATDNYKFQLLCLCINETSLDPLDRLFLLYRCLTNGGLGLKVIVHVLKRPQV